jgi:DNA-binding Lrp family transcriptional regulator
MDRERITRKTSRDCFRELVVLGLLPEMRRKVYRWLYNNGPATRNEVAQGIDMVPNDTSTRLKELRNLGVVREVGEDKCRVTSRNVILYDVTDRMPTGSAYKNSKPKPHIHAPKNCGECPLVVEQEGRDKCWMDLSLSANYDKRPKGCQLDMRDFIIRGG